MPWTSRNAAGYSAQRESELGVEAKTLHGRAFRDLVFALVLICLLTTNVLSLVSDSFHNRAYGMLASLFSTSLLQPFAPKVLENSPTAVRQSEVAIATAALQAEKEALALARGAAERQAAAAAVEVATVTASYAAQTATMKRVAASIARRTIANVERNVGSVFGEAIPYFGTTIMLSVTAWDVKDACDTLRQLEELEGKGVRQPGDQTLKVCGMRVPSASEALQSVKNNWQAVYRETARRLNQGAENIPAVPSLPNPQQVKDWLSPVLPIRVP